mgnify:FL=1|tara:strand:+ start:1250 stop:1735 length:486 start_codon:yes stop_codon:yes gene_type:complete
MHDKNNNKTKSYIQGLRPFSSSIPKTLRKYLKKGGYNYSNIIDNWTGITSKKISDACYPLSIKMNKEMRGGTLILNVIHGKEMEIEYEKNEIIDKINSFFGYNCISNIILKIVQEKVEKNKKTFTKINNLDKINEKMNKVSNENLKISLKNFLKAYNDKSK